MKYDYHWASFHKSLIDVLVPDTRSQVDGWALSPHKAYTLLLCEECLESNHIGICPKNKECLPPSQDLKPAHYSGDGHELHSVVVLSYMAVWTLLFKTGT